VPRGDVLEPGGDAMVVLFAGAGHERSAAIAAADTQHPWPLTVESTHPWRRPVAHVVRMAIGRRRTTWSASRGEP
jgi:hypothetical protein